jgi:hypothetical protein
VISFRFKLAVIFVGPPPKYRLKGLKELEEMSSDEDVLNPKDCMT